MSANRLNIVAFYAEGASVILVDANGVEHKCDAPDELWAAMWTIRSDPSLPSAENVTPEVVLQGAQVEEEDDEEAATYGLVAQQVGASVGNAYGPLVGQLCEGMVRNGGPRVIRFLRKISR